jgi:hypothetical protein
VERAARLIDTGLWSLSVMGPGGNTRDELKAAAQSVQGAARQVAAAVRQARRIWDEHAQGGHAGAGAAADKPGPGNVPWRDLQRETVQQWRTAQRAQQQEWRAAKQRMKQELREEVRQAAWNQKEEARRRRAD